MWPFKKSQPKEKALQKLVFKDGRAFFDYQCKYGETDIIKDRGIVAIVADAKREFGAPEVIKIEPNGSQLAVLRVVSQDGGFIVFANTPTNVGDKLIAGDLVIWVPSIFSKEIGTGMGDERSGWVGMIRAKIAPEIDLSKSDFNIACRYD